MSLALMALTGPLNGEMLRNGAICSIGGLPEGTTVDLILTPYDPTVVATAKNGDGPLIVMAYLDAWSIVKYAGKSAFIASKYLKVDPEATRREEAKEVAALPKSVNVHGSKVRLPKTGETWIIYPNVKVGYIPTTRLQPKQSSEIEREFRRPCSVEVVGDAVDNDKNIWVPIKAENGETHWLETILSHYEDEVLIPDETSAAPVKATGSSPGSSVDGDAPSLRKVIPVEEKNFPSGYEVVAEPSGNAPVLKKMPPGSAMIAAYLDAGGHRYYMTDWSYERHLTGMKPNWIRPLGGSQKSDVGSEPPSPSSGAPAYRIAGVPAGETLNIRGGPGTSFPIVTKLSNGDGPVHVTGDPVMNGEAEWVPIAFMGGKGWARSKYLNR